jgi:hypothetical protein
MTDGLSQRAGSAVRWRTAQLVGVNGIFLIRVLVLARILAPDAFGLLAIALVPIGVLLQASETGMLPALVHSEAPERRHYDVAWTIGSPKRPTSCACWRCIPCSAQLQASAWRISSDISSSAR